MANPAQVIEYDEKTDTAVYDAENIEYVIDTGIPVECPYCGDSTYISYAVDDGCWNDDCDGGPWSLEVRQNV